MAFSIRWFKIVIRAEGLTKYYHDFKAIEGLDFEVKEGEIFGLVGPNGAGKTTTIKILLGLIEATSGDAFILDQKASPDNTDVKRFLGFLPEESPVYEDMMVEDYLMFFSELYGVDKVTAKERIWNTLTSLNLTPDSKRIGELSKGMKRKVVIARSLINDPKVLIYDEPTSGLDASTSHFIIKYIEKLKGKKTIILTTHNLFQAEQICDRILILKDGKKQAYGTVDELKDRFGETEYSIMFKVDDATKIDAEIEEKEDHYNLRTTDADLINTVAKDVITANGTIIRMDTHRPTLEDVFISITS